MENVEKILDYAWNKDSSNLKPALDAEMQARVSAAMNDMVADVSASLFAGASEPTTPPSQETTD